jgi:hypothetical protein
VRRSVEDREKNPAKGSAWLRKETTMKFWAFPALLV